MFGIILDIISFTFILAGYTCTVSSNILVYKPKNLDIIGLSGISIGVFLVLL